MKKKYCFCIYLTKKTEFILSSEIKCPKSVISTNNYWVGRVGQSNFASYHSSFFSGAVEKFFGKRWLRKNWLVRLWTRLNERTCGWLTFNLDGCCGLRAASRCGRLARVSGGVVRSNNVESETTETVFIVSSTVGHCSAIFEPLDQWVCRVALQAALECKPVTW